MTGSNQGTTVSASLLYEIMDASCENPPQDLMWEYESKDCKITFETPVPKGPREERLTRCPSCDSAEIKRNNIVKLSKSKCGG